MNDFKSRFVWQQALIPQVVHLIAPHLIQVSSHEVDCNEAGDLTIIFPRNGTVAVRLRTPDASRFTGDFTLRSRTKHNAKSEVSKIIDGKADFFFYGHVDRADRIWFWHLLDCQQMRAEFIRHPRLLREAINRERQNKDGTAFISFNIERDLRRCVMHGVTPQSMEAA